MVKNQRHEIILDYLSEHRYARVDDLAEVTKASEITIRRDINELSKKGRLKKVYGGAEALNIVKEDISILKRIRENKSQKQHIAKKASEYIEDGQVVYLDAGSTTHRLIPYLKNRNITVFTHGVHHLEELAKHGIKTHLVGGVLKEKTQATIGSTTLIYLSQFRFDVAFMGANAVDSHFGFMTPDVAEGMVKKKVIEQSDKVFILADFSKFNRASSVVFADKETPVITNKIVGNAYIDFDVLL